MNPILRAMSLFGRGGLSGAGSGFASGSPDILNSPDMLGQGSRYVAMGGARMMPKLPAVDRIKDAFSAIKDMHKDGSQEPTLDASNMPWMGSLTFPGKLPASQGFPAQNAPAPGPAPMNAQASIPMPAPRPQEAPQANPFMAFFQRSAALQRDPITGDYLDPEAAQKADPSVFKGLFS